MGEEVISRCWARHHRSGALCERMAEPAMDHIHIGGRPSLNHDVVWNNTDCAINSGPNERKTAALRILEVAHEIDRMAFTFGETVEEYDMLRAIASRLYCNTIAAGADVASIEQHLRALDIDSEATEEERRAGEETIALIRQAADMLRPWAGKA